MLYITIVIIVVCIYSFIVYNRLVKANNIVKEAFSTMDIYLKKRWDLVPNLVEVVKGYAEYEKETFQQITSLRTKDYDDMTMNKKISTNEQLTQDISKIMAILENYPELKANESFLRIKS